MTLPSCDIQAIALAAGSISADAKLADQLCPSILKRELDGALGDIDVIDIVREQEHLKRAYGFASYKQLMGNGAFDLQARSMLEALTSTVEAVRLAGEFELPTLLNPYRIADSSLAAQIAEAQGLSRWDERYARSLNLHSAFSGMLDQIDAVGRDTWIAVDTILDGPLFEDLTVRQARELLDISGLLRYPRLRPLNSKERKQRAKWLIQDSTIPQPVKRAQSLVYRYEKVLRALIAQCMQNAYGDDWAQTRLPICSCKKLLGKEIADDESVLDAADYCHYIDIMCHEEHYEAVFRIAYDDVDKLRLTIKRLGQLRAMSHHGRTFTASHLHELATLWRVMEAGFSSLIDDVVIDA